jgi:hypothetical protein
MTDRTRKNYWARRLDGQTIKPGVKAVCVTGSQASWPIGLEKAQDFPCIALCEGEMDFLAAFALPKENRWWLRSVWLERRIEFRLKLSRSSPESVFASSFRRTGREKKPRRFHLLVINGKLYKVPSGDLLAMK